MTDTKKDQRALVKVKDLNGQQLDAAIDKALDAYLGRMKTRRQCLPEEL